MFSADSKVTECVSIHLMAACGVCSLTVLVTPHLSKTLDTACLPSPLHPNVAPPLPVLGAMAMTLTAPQSS